MGKADLDFAQIHTSEWIQTISRNELSTKSGASCIFVKQKEKRKRKKR